ncbi:MAG: low molecular weight phosphatase family protein [Planctomycetes bacterium]|nr:low molecular weight phosphatase family protein [Planctomycetota bacterium]
MKTVLFLCTGNYYRSRYAEALFNHRAADAGLPWRAVSRGFRLHPYNVGPISTFTLRRLEAQGVTLAEVTRFPVVVSEEDLAGASLVVAVKENEHRPLLEARFPAWSGRVEYWTIDDVHDTEPDVALAQVDRAVIDLQRRLRDHD